MTLRNFAASTVLFAAGALTATSALAFNPINPSPLPPPPTPLAFNPINPSPLPPPPTPLA